MWKYKKLAGDNMNQNHSINWSDKVKSLDQNIRDEIGILDDTV